MKKTLAICLVLGLLLGCLPAHAATFDPSVYSSAELYTIIHQCESELTKRGSTPGGELWGYTIKGLATRTGPSTTYQDAGSYPKLVNTWVQVRARAWDKRNAIWWVEVLVGDQWVWTGYKRFDSEQLPLESIPIKTIK